MNPKSAVNFFKKSENLAMALGVGAHTVYAWLRKDFIPLKAQQKIEKLTKKKLKADEALVTLDQLEKMGKNRAKLINMTEQTIKSWKKKGTIPFSTQRSILPLIKKWEKKQEKSHALAVDRGATKKQRD